MKIRRISILLLLVTVMALIVGVVSAQSQPGDGGRGGRGAGGFEMGGRGFGAGVRGLLQIAAEEIGLSPREVLEQLRSGSTLAEVIEANGGSVEAVTIAAVERATERINQAVENGRITQERADALIANLESQITNALNLDLVQRQQTGEIVRRVAGETGLGIREVVQQWREGTTLGEILTTNGENVQTFIDETLVRIEERLTQAVTNGRLTQEQADQRLSNLREFLPDFLNQPFPIEGDSQALDGDSI